MTAPKHTPGPWGMAAWEKDMVHVVRMDSGRNRPGASSLVIARVTCRVTWFYEQKANAHLIAAAPELYAALAWYVENDDVNEEPGNEHWLEGRDRAKAALAKARGDGHA